MCVQTVFFIPAGPSNLGMQTTLSENMEDDMERVSLAKELSSTTYPGRGIVIGRTKDGKKAVTAYFIMGRSENSRNRVFVEDGEGIRTQAFDPSKLEDPSLIIYAPVRVLGNKTIVTNGDQTDTIYELMDKQQTFEQALRTREFEPDAPNYTPRISGIMHIDNGEFNYAMSILKSNNGNPDACNRYTFAYSAPVAGEGHFIHTYMGDGNPLPSFEGEPTWVDIDGDIDEFTDMVWENLNEDNKVSLFVRYIAAVGQPLSDVEKKIYWVDDMDIEFTPLANAYIRARGADRMSSFGDFISLSDVCDKSTALVIKREVSDGVIAPGYTDEALEILKAKKKGNYCVIEIDPSYEPAPIERKDVFGITFEQGRNELHIDDDFFSNIVTENKELTEQAKIDLAISMITLKYTQSNSVCYVKGGQAIGIGAGQQSRIHCTRLAGSKADNWWLRQSPQVLGLQFVDGIRRADRDNTIDLYIGEDYMDVLAEGEWQKFFKVKPDVFTAEEKRAWLDKNTDVALGSDAFFPFGDNIERAHKSGVKYVAQPGGSVRDDHVIDTCNKYGMVMSFTGIRLFHH